MSNPTYSSNTYSNALIAENDKLRAQRDKLAAALRNIQLLANTAAIDSSRMPERAAAACTYGAVLDVSNECRAALAKLSD